jgi:hypothetical protein
MPPDPNDRLVTVCAACLCASCWHGEFMCYEAIGANTVQRTVGELRKLNREHPSAYSVEKVRRVCGSV